jgi:transcriptional regulator with XRE-family HTH domain
MLNNLRKAVKKSGLPRHEVARRCGYHVSMLTGVINGYFPPSAKLKSGLTKVLGETEEYLFSKEKVSA